MGAELSYQDFTACSPQPVAGSRVSYIYQPTSASFNLANDASAAPTERVKSAPVGRHDVTPLTSATDSISSVSNLDLETSNGMRANNNRNVTSVPSPSSETARESPVSSASLGTNPMRFLDKQEMTSSMSECDCACHGDCVSVKSMQCEVNLLKMELSQTQKAVASLKHNEAILRQRLSEQAQRQIEKGSTRFEDLSLGNMRPTQLIRRYGNLYSEGRLDALDALDDIPEMSNFDDLKGKLLLTILVLSFRNAHKNIAAIKAHIRHLLHIPSITGSIPDYATESTAKELDEVVSVYLRKTVDRFDLSRNYKEVCDRVWDTLYDFPSLRHCTGLLRYIDECVRLAWALSVQILPFSIHYEHSHFQPELLTRFHTSDPSSDTVKTVLWPSLTEGVSGPCVYKGVVIT